MIQIILDPVLAEEAVLRAIAAQPRERELRAARDAAYCLDDADARERAFADLHVSWFAKLDLGQPLRLALGELPALAATCARALVRPARRRADEGADLLVRAEDGERTIAVQVRPDAFAAPAALLELLRWELRHVADMVDPAFAYRPELPLTDAGPSRTPLLRDRYRVLWDTVIAGRLERAGLLAPERGRAVRAAFARAFPMLGDESEAVYRRFHSGAAATHDEILALALEPRAGDAGAGLRPGEACPVCRFPTHDLEPRADDLPAPVVASIQRDIPSWRPSSGLCRQCADLYRARVAAAPRPR
jgi:hypothetical protein